MDDELKRRGGRPTKPAEPSDKKIKLSLTVPAETKIVLDEARERGRSQSEEAVRLIGLGRLLEQHGRFLLPVFLQQRAIELLTAHDAGIWTMINYLMSEGNPDEKERAIRWFSADSALRNYRANNPIVWPPAEEVAQNQEEQAPPADSGAAEPPVAEPDAA